MLDGYLTEKQCTELIELGLDINKIYDDEPRYYIKEVFRRPSKKELQEDCDLDENDVILVDAKLIYTENINRFKDTKNTHYYLTIPCYLLIKFLSDRLIGGFKIDCLYPEVDRALLPYKRIEYMDKQKKQVFETTPPKPFSLEDLLFRFISFLLVNKKYLIDISFFDYA